VGIHQIGMPLQFALVKGLMTKGPENQGYANTQKEG
jgi:hypothetical protein